MNRKKKKEIKYGKKRMKEKTDAKRNNRNKRMFENKKERMNEERKR